MVLELLDVSIAASISNDVTSKVATVLCNIIVDLSVLATILLI